VDGVKRAKAVAVTIVTPAARGTHTGNRVTALRWAKRLRELGHRVSIAERYDEAACDCLVALHALKSADSIERCHERAPHTPIVVALTGTDVYGEHVHEALRSLEIASAIVALQPLALEKLPRPLRSKAHVIYQSAAPM
jgi:hypothetical protein